MPSKTPSPFGPGRWIRWIQGPVWSLLAVAALILELQQPSTLHLVLMVVFAILGAFWTWVMLRERAIIRWDEEHPGLR